MSPLNFTGFVLCWISLLCATVSCLTIGTNVNVELTPTEDGLVMSASRDDELLLNGTLLLGRNLLDCTVEPFSCKFDDLTLNLQTSDDGLHVLWQTEDLNQTFMDCFDISSGTHWFGGPETGKQIWPIDKMTINGTKPYVLRGDNQYAVMERYWLNSKGAYVRVLENVPLFVDQNEMFDKKICFIANATEPYINRTRNFLEYDLVFKEDAKEAHLHAVNNHLGKPKDIPNEKMAREPIWTTWARYKLNVSDAIVLEFAQEIRDNGYENGQLEIDDYWEVCYGAQEFSQERFPDIKNTVKKLKEMNFRVTLWMHPFVNKDCSNNSVVGAEKGYFVKNAEGEIEGSWWNGKHAYQIDFTNPEAAKWYKDRVQGIQDDYGFDGFKFDGGETTFAPQPAVYENVDQETIPHNLSGSYFRTAALFGDLVEVRAAWRTQDLAIFLRMDDKDSNWGDTKGLYTLITTLLALNMNGYTMILPDMIGGNGYRGATPDAELLVRWTQANAFMPSMQFSFKPWEISSDEFDTAEIVKKFVDLHQNVSSTIIEAMEKSVTDGHPVNPPIWWIDPTDSTALACDNEFLLGDSILVAPVIKDKARSRKVYLPKGQWRDGNNGTIYEGPLTIEEYPAPIEVLPHFYRITEN